MSQHRHNASTNSLAGLADIAGGPVWDALITGLPDQDAQKLTRTVHDAVSEQRESRSASAA